MMLPIRLVSLLLVGSAVGGFSPARAQPASAAAQKRKPTPTELDEARKHFENAEAAKARRQYQTAAVEYLAAYELFAEPEFFYNVAEVYRLAGDEKNALTYYEKYLELDPRGRGAPAARVASRELRASIAATEDAARRAVEDDAKRKAEAQRQKEAEEAARLAEQKPRPKPIAAQPTQSPGRGLRIAGIATGGAGVIAIGIGIVFGVRARSIGNEAAIWDTFDPARYDEGKAAQRNMVVFTGIGAAVVIAGGVLYYLGHKAGQPADAGKTLTVAPALGPSGFGVAAAVRF